MNHRHNFLFIFGCIFVLVLGLFSLSANDGRDRYAGAYSNTLYLFPDAPVFQSGYRLLKKDEPGGADGTRAFRWGQPQAIALVRVAAHKTQETLGKGKFPMPIFDFSSENGDTPVDFVTGKPPRGRHPGGSHDGGINLDLGYYLTSLKGLQYTPDHSACTNHFDSPDKNAKDAYICKGPADRLDVPRQTFFMLQLFKINRELFHSNLLEQIGMDWKIQIAVMKKLEEWLLDNKYGVTLEHIKDMRELCTADSFEGWAYSHHHHIHLRLCDISVFGKYRDAFLKLLEAERQLDYQLLLANTKKGTTLLRVRLQSYAMNRAVEVELMDKVSIKTGVRFRLDGGEWVAADPASWSRKKAFLECPLNLQKNEKLVKVEVEITPPKGKKTIEAVSLSLPRLDSNLFVAVKPSKVNGSVTKSGDIWKLQVSVPQAYSTYITGLSFDIYRIKGESSIIENVEGSLTDFSYTLNNPPTSPPIALIKAKLKLSSRMTVSIPIYCKAK